MFGRASLHVYGFYDRVLALEADVRDRRAADDVVRRAVEKFGKLDSEFHLDANESAG